MQIPAYSVRPQMQG